MSEKRNKTWKHLYLSIACMILISLTGCAMLKEMKTTGETREYRVTAQKLLDQGDYEGALKENQKVLSLCDNVPPADDAFFNIGVIYAHYEYSKKNYQKSLDHFKRLLKIFPQSPLAAQAKIWIGMLQENERLGKKIEEMNMSMKKSMQIDIEIDEKKKAVSK